MRYNAAALLGSALRHDCSIPGLAGGSASVGVGSMTMNLTSILPGWVARLINLGCTVAQNNAIEDFAGSR